MITPKDLKKLAKACREAGIRKYKCAEFEFELDDAPPQQRAPSSLGGSEEFTSDSPSPEDLMFWSAGLPGGASGVDEAT
jgi:hypothetical protein